MYYILDDYYCVKCECVECRLDVQKMLDNLKRSKGVLSTHSITVSKDNVVRSLVDKVNSLSSIGIIINVTLTPTTSEAHLSITHISQIAGSSLRLFCSEYVDDELTALDFTISCTLAQLPNVNFILSNYNILESYRMYSALGMQDNELDEVIQHEYLVKLTEVEKSGILRT